MIKYTDILSEASLVELSQDFQEDWSTFEKYVISNKGKKYWHQMLEDIHEAIDSGWVGTVDSAYESKDFEPIKRGDTLLQFNKKYPEYIKYVRRVLRKKWGDTIEMYRGIKARPKIIHKKNAQMRKMIDDAQINLKSYKGHTLFSWTNDRDYASYWSTSHADVFRKDLRSGIREAFYTTLVAQVPIDKIVWCGLPVERAFDMVTDTEFIVNCGRGIVAKVESDVVEYGNDPYTYIKAKDIDEKIYVWQHKHTKYNTIFATEEYMKNYRLRDAYYKVK